MSDGSAAPFDDDEYRRWREEADRALAGGEAQAAVGLHNWACFAAEQSARLALKALLHGIGREARGHDLVVLGNRLQEAGFDLTSAVSDVLRDLGRHYIPARYPDAHASGPPGAHYGESDWKRASAGTRTVLDLVDRLWSRLLQAGRDKTT